MFFNIVAFMVIVRGVSDFAVFALYTGIYLTFEMIKQGLLRNPTIKFLGMKEMTDQREEVQTASLALNIAVSALAILCIALFNQQIAGFLKTPSLQPLLWWSMLYILVLIPFSHCEVILQANFQFQRIFRGYIARQAFFFSAVLLLFFAARPSFTVLNIVKLQIASLVVGAIVLWFNARPYLIKRIHYNGRIMGRMFHFGKFIFGTNLFSTLSRVLDRFITANVLTNPVSRNAYVSYYETVGRINTLIDIPSLAAADVLFPKNVETVETDGLHRVKYYFEKMIGTILAVIIPISLLIFIFPKLIIIILAGKSYLGAVPILQMTILFSIVRPLSYQFGSTLDAIGKPQINFWINFLMLLVGLGFNYFALKMFGGIGAAYATIAFYIVSFFIMIAVLKKYIQIELRKIYSYTLQSYSEIFSKIRSFANSRKKVVQKSESSPTSVS